MFKSTILNLALLIAFQNTLCIKVNEVKYFLFTPTNQNSSKNLNLGQFKSGCCKDLVDPKNTVKILCHGYMNHGLSYWIKPTKDAFIKNNYSNIISVDWGKLAGTSYDICVLKARDIGEQIAKLIMEMKEVFGIPYKKFHLIGYSIGAHIVGFAGKTIFKLTEQKIGRITALDPAGTSFNDKSTEKRLSENDALFVDAIHTDTILLGYETSLAHADFWPNNGFSQPGCHRLQTGCSHRRAVIYFYESIGNNVFPAWECDSFANFINGTCSSNKMVYMGNNCNTSARGNFYLTTNKESPYGLSSN